VAPLRGSPPIPNELDFRIEDNKGVTSATKANWIRKRDSIHSETYDSARDHFLTPKSQFLSTHPRLMSEEASSNIIKDFQQLEDFENIENLGAFVSRKVTPGKILIECSKEDSNDYQEQDNNFAEETILSEDGAES
jgi:hypothetical protein